MELLRVLITVKTYPIPTKKYDELVCTAGVTETGEFVRLYPINFRELPFSGQYRKYQWIEVMAEKHTGRDSRKESYRPNCDTLKMLGEPIATRRGDWSERAKYVLVNQASSMEALYDLQEAGGTSLGIIKPKRVRDLVIETDDPEWKPRFLQELKQARIWDDRKITKQPPRKVPFKFSYQFECNDSRCNGNHKMMIEDWEVGRLYWRLIDNGDSPEKAANKVRDKFLTTICGPDKNTYFYVGTILAYPKSWVVIGTFYPKKTPAVRRKKNNKDRDLPLFDDQD